MDASSTDAAGRVVADDVTAVVAATASAKMDSEDSGLAGHITTEVANNICITKYYMRELHAAP